MSAATESLSATQIAEILGQISKPHTADYLYKTFKSLRRLYTQYRLKDRPTLVINSPLQGFHLVDETQQIATAMRMMLTDIRAVDLALVMEVINGMGLSLTCTVRPHPSRQRYQYLYHLHTRKGIIDFTSSNKGVEQWLRNPNVS